MCAYYKVRESWVVVRWRFLTDVGMVPSEGEWKVGPG